MLIGMSFINILRSVAARNIKLDRSDGFLRSEQHLFKAYFEITFGQRLFPFDSITVWCPTLITVYPNEPHPSNLLRNIHMPKRVLIADDDSKVRQVMKAFLAAGTNVEVCGEAVNGLEAVEKARTLKPDLVLLDLAMPEMNGAEAASVLKKRMPELPIILFTMFSENIGRYLTSAVGVDMVLSKPDGVARLAESVNAVLALSSEPIDEKKIIR